MDFTPYTTVAGDTWSRIAFKAYGDDYAYEDIMRDNPNVPYKDVLPEGIKLRLRVKEKKSVSNPDKLPPWKQ